MLLFIAVNFNEPTKAGLLALRNNLQANSERGNFSRPENLHLTLAFLGECDTKQAAAVKAAMDSVVFRSFEITIDRIGRFKRGGKASDRPGNQGDIWWAGVRESRSLFALQRDLSGALASAGFKPDSRKFNPHITLGREVVTEVIPWRIEPFGETVSSIELMKSERHPKTSTLECQLATRLKRCALASHNGKLIYTAIYSTKPAPERL